VSPPDRADLDALLAAARGGDDAAGAALVRASQAEVWRFVASLVGVDAADDVTQDTYLRVFRAMPEFAGRSTTRTWLLSIARRACADHVRAAVRQRRLAGAAARAAGGDTTPDHAGLLGAADLLRRLDPDRRSAFVLTQVLGLSYAEAAEAEGVPVGTIRSRVARARAALVEAVSTAAAS